MEIEIKAKVKDFKSIKRNLKKINAKFVGQKSQLDLYYSLYKRPLGKKSGNIFRLRCDRITKETRLEFHKPKNMYAAEEIELEVADFKTAKRLLEEMKAKPEFVVDKKRLVYKKGRVEIVLDTIKTLGNFIEVEIAGQDTARNRNALYYVLHKLGVDDDQIILHERYHGMILKRKGKAYAYF